MILTERFSGSGSRKQRRSGLTVWIEFQMLILEWRQIHFAKFRGYSDMTKTTGASQEAVL